MRSPSTDWLASNPPCPSFFKEGDCFGGLFGCCAEPCDGFSGLPDGLGDLLGCFAVLPDGFGDLFSGFLLFTLYLRGLLRSI